MNKNLKIALMIVIFLVIAGCSKAEQNNNYIGEKDKIMVALVYPKTGTDWKYGQQFYKAAIMAQNVINENGGVNGKQLQFTIIDSKNSPNESKEVAEKLVKRNDILCVIADSNNYCTEAAASIYEEHHITQITPMASSSEFAASGYYQFSASPARSFNTEFDVQKIICDEMKCKSVGIIYINSSWADASLKVFEETAEQNKLQIRVKEPIADGQTRFNAIIHRLRQTNPDCLYILADYNETIKCLQAIRIERWNVPVVVNGSYITEQANNVIGTSMGKVVSQRLNYLDVEMQEKENFIYEYRDVAQYSDMEFGMKVYDTVMMVAKAAETCGDNITRENFRSSLMKVKSFNGILGDVFFDETGTAQRPFFVAEYKRSRWGVMISWEDIKEYLKTQ